jgi:hypothetical protein
LGGQNDFFELFFEERLGPLRVVAVDGLQVDLQEVPMAELE